MNVQKCIKVFDTTIGDLVYSVAIFDNLTKYY